MVGVFINTLPVRVNVEGDALSVSWMRRLQEQQSEMRQYDHSALPTSRGGAKFRVGSRSLKACSCFRTTRSTDSETAAGTNCPSDLPRVVDQTNYPLTLIAAPGPPLLVQLSYDPERFEEETIVRLGHHLQTLLGAIAADPERAVDALPIMPAWERERVLTTWNATRTSVPAARTLDGLLGVQAARTPQAVALVGDGQTLTYAALDAAANQLAHYLRAQGVGRETRVGVWLPRSVDLVVALIAILKAGGAYVPLDPSYPRERLAFMLTDAGAALLLTTTAQPPLVAPDRTIPRVNLDRIGPELATWPVTAPPATSHPAALAYVIYTSGSTGTPKGVMIEHQAICNRLLWMQSTEPLTADDRVLQKTAFGFDASVMEFFAPLIAGATLVLARPDGQQDPRYLVRTVVEQRITLLQVVPALLRGLLKEPELEACVTLRRVICAGEVLTAELQDRFLSRLPQAILHNFYGPTEAAIDVTAWTCRLGDTGIVPIGRPIANMRAYVLDACERPVPIGVTGALCIGGAQLARGYSASRLSRRSGSCRIHLAANRVDGCIGRAIRRAGVWMIASCRFWPRRPPIKISSASERAR